ncbi:MAG TPA: anhydro-N-acetylmuramic acid kinase [Gaiellaceae bacterium]|nr:anhydro-N-acetylmuramic acid kinase [Gaiellaceae bacterium]
MRVIGLISGTSFDAIEAAAVDFELAGEVLEARLVATSSRPYESQLRSRIAAALPPARTTLAEVCELDTLIGQAFAEAAATLELDSPAELVCSHGQTVFHWVKGTRALGTLQLGQPAWIAERLGVPVVSDVRIGDIAVGGQGAPLASVLDVLLLGDSDRPCAALNLGGIANVTVIRPGEEPFAYDTGPANALLDLAMARDGAGETFDRDGARARRGRVDAALLERLLSEPYYRLEPPKTTGKELFHAEYLADVRLPLDDLLATLVALTVETLARELERWGVERVVASGGGARNPAIMEGLRMRLPGVAFSIFDELGVPAESKEAVVFALIGFLTAHGLSGAIPSCTGAARAVVLGTITPGAAPLVLPKPVTVAPRRLVLHAEAPA